MSPAASWGHFKVTWGFPVSPPESPHLRHSSVTWRVLVSLQGHLCVPMSLLEVPVSPGGSHCHLGGHWEGFGVASGSPGKSRGHFSITWGSSQCHFRVTWGSPCHLEKVSVTLEVPMAPPPPPPKSPVSLFRVPIVTWGHSGVSVSPSVPPDVPRVSPCPFRAPQSPLSGSSSDSTGTSLAGDTSGTRWHFQGMGTLGWWHVGDALGTW